MRRVSSVSSLLSTHTHIDIDVRNVFNQFVFVQWFREECMFDLLYRNVRAVEWKRKTNNPLVFFSARALVRKLCTDQTIMRPPPAPHRFPFAHSRVIRATQPLAKKHGVCDAARLHADSQPANNAGNCFVLHHASQPALVTRETHENHPNQSSGMRISCGVWISYFCRPACSVGVCLCVLLLLFCCALFAREIARAIGAIASRLSTSA